MVGRMVFAKISQDYEDPVDFQKTRVTVFNHPTYATCEDPAPIELHKIPISSLDYQTSHFSLGFIGVFFGQLNSSANSLEFDNGPITLKLEDMF